MKAVKPPVSSWMRRTHFEVIDALLERLAAAEHHGGGGAHAERVRHAVHFSPFLGRALQAADAAADLVVQNLRAAAGDRIEARVAQPRDGVARATGRSPRRCSGSPARRSSAGGSAEALLDRAQQVLVPLDLQVRVQAALHQDARAAQLEGLLDLLEDRLLGDARSPRRAPAGGRRRRRCSTRCRSWCS